MKTEYRCNGWAGGVGKCCVLHEMLNASDKLTPYQADSFHKIALLRQTQEQRAEWLTRAAMAISLLSLVISGFAVIKKLNAERPLPIPTMEGGAR